MNNSTTKNKKRVSANQHQTLMLTKESKLNGFSVRLAEGESWDNNVVELAMLVVGETYLEKLQSPQPTNDAGLRMNQISIRRNHFEPEFEPSRHEMRIFDALDGVVTEM